MGVEIQSDATKITCKHCGSEAVIRFGTYKGVQRFRCKSCGRKFKADDSLFYMKKPADYVSTALSMYYSGSSIKDISDHLNQQYGYRPSKSVIFSWVDKYTGIAAGQFQDAHPKVGDTWVCDETVLDLDKGVKVWFFDCIDSETRYLLSSRATLSRTTRDAQLLMDRAIKRAGKHPKVVVTDKLASYLDVDYGKGEHRRGGPFKVLSSGDSTAQIERFHGTIKDRTKVMRAFRDLETLHTFMNGYLTYYNYFKPNEALGGKTPAEAAGVEYEVKNWRDLCRLPAPKAERTQTPIPQMVIREVRTDKPIKLAAQPKVTITEVHEPVIRESHRAPRISPRAPRITPRHPRVTDLGAGIVHDRRGRHLRLW